MGKTHFILLKMAKEKKRKKTERKKKKKKKKERKKEERKRGLDPVNKLQFLHPQLHQRP